MTTRVASMLLLSVVFAACTYVMPTPAPSTCGDGTTDENETCDDGNDIDGDDCDTNCTPTQCGNGITSEKEECDDGNNENGDACNTDCKITICGDKLVQPGEECDDGNLLNGDGCDSNCTHTRCGNGIQANGEVCDDGNTNNGDGCDPTCTLTNTTSIVIGTLNTPGFADGAGTNAQLSGRLVMTIYGQTLFIAGGNVVRKVDLAAKNTVTTIAGLGGTPGTADGSSSGLDARFDWMEGIATDGQTLWIADGGNHLLRSISLTAPYPVVTEAGHTTANNGTNFTSIPGTGSAVEFDDLRGLAYYNGLVYMLDCDAAVLQTFNPQTKEVKNIAGQPYAIASVDGNGLSARFVNPRHLVSNGAGLLYISDFDGHMIRIFDTATNEVTTLAGSGACGYVDDVGTSALLYLPRGIATDGLNVFFTEPPTHTIRQVGIGNKIVTTLSGTPPGCIADCTCPWGGGSYLDGVGKEAKWNMPWGIVYDPETKSLLVSDSDNFVIRRIK